MLSSKNKAYLVKICNDVKPVSQVGKGGFNEKLVSDLMNYLRKHEVMKVSILANCPMEPVEIAECFNETAIEVVKVIGRTLILYYDNKDLKGKDKIVFPA